MKFAYFGLPHVGGTYSVFRYLHSGLAGHDVELRWIGRGPWADRNDPQWQSELQFGEVVDVPRSEPEKRQAVALLQAIEAGAFDGVFVNVLADRIQTNVVRYLPRDMLRIMIVHSITPGTYAGARTIRDHVHATVGISERCRHDLVRLHGSVPERTFTIPNPVDVTRLASLDRVANRADQLRLLYLGRIEDAPKGVLWLPRIVDLLPRTVSLTIAGDGPDLQKLRREMSRHGDRVAFLGSVAADRVPQLLATHDVVVAPSRFEGFGLSTVEAMAAGCVPVVSHIRLVTDRIVDHGENGFLFKVGDLSEAARHIGTLDGDHALLARMSEAARTKARRSFDLGRTAESYARLMKTIAASPPSIAAPLDIDVWKLPGGLRSGLRTYVPRPVKNWLRVLRERV